MQDSSAQWRSAWRWPSDWAAATWPRGCWRTPTEAARRRGPSTAARHTSAAPVRRLSGPTQNGGRRALSGWREWCACFEGSSKWLAGREVGPEIYDVRKDRQKGIFHGRTDTEG